MNVSYPGIIYRDRTKAFICAVVLWAATCHSLPTEIINYNYFHKFKKCLRQWLNLGIIILTLRGLSMVNDCVIMMLYLFIIFQINVLEMSSIAICYSVIIIS